jgi:hypothetical protein
MVAKRVQVSTAYRAENPRTGIRAPPTSGPAMAPACITVTFRALAAGSWCAGSSRGSTALLVGWLIAKNACWTANSARSSHTSFAPAAAWAQNAALDRISPTVVTRRIERRSSTSASAPPHSPKTTSGTSPKTPVRPTYADEPVIA